MANPHIKLEHIDNLTRGKKSGNNIGSRSVGHHLYQHERKEYQQALKRKYLVVSTRSRNNLWNVWEKVCQAKQWPFYVIEKDDDQAHVHTLQGVIKTDRLQSCKQFIQTKLHA